MFKLEHTQTQLKLFFEDHLFLQHSLKKPCIMIGKGSAKYKLKHDKFRIKEKTVHKIKLAQFSIKSNTDQEVIIHFSGGKKILQVIFRKKENFLEIIPKALDSEINRLWISIAASPQEAIYGCGAQFAELNLKGKIIPIWVEDHSPVAKSQYAYFPLPTFLSIGDHYYFLHIETTFYTEFNFTKESCHELSIWEIPSKIIIGMDKSAISLIKLLSDYFGRQPAMPDWVYDGLILGVQGGNEIVEQKIEKTLNAGVKLTAVWCQDWQGIRMTSFGQQLFWNWRYDKNRYPDLPHFIKELNKKDIKFLGYMNQFIPTDAPLYEQAAENGYCVKNAEREDYIIYTTDFPTAILDVSNPKAREWMKMIIKQNMLDIGLSGWMHDYGEYLPTDAILNSGADAEGYHNYYPVEFTKMAHQALEEGKQYKNIFIFYRSGFSHVSKYMMCYFSGDQLVDWNKINGIPTVIPCGISIGLCGIGNYCYDIGGYTTYGPYKRTKEMFMRGAEMAAFSMVMRTHEGNRPYDNWQHDADGETLNHLAKMVKIHVDLKPYLKHLSKEYQDDGIPPIRPCFLHYENDAELHTLKYQYLFGKDLLIAPVIEPQTFTWKTYFPDDEWIHIWSGKEYKKGWYEIDAPFGYPPVFYRKGSEFTTLFEGIKNL